LSAAKTQSDGDLTITGVFGGTSFRPSAPIPQFLDPLDLLGVAGMAEGIASSSITTALAA
jgi:hypothetical protein